MRTPLLRISALSVMGHLRFLTAVYEELLGVDAPTDDQIVTVMSMSCRITRIKEWLRGHSVTLVTSDAVYEVYQEEQRPNTTYQPPLDELYSRAKFSEGKLRTELSGAYYDISFEFWACLVGHLNARDDLKTAIRRNTEPSHDEWVIYVH